MNLFKPDNFKDDPYGHATNQISHAALSLFVVYWMPLIAGPLAIFWLVWEGLQYRKSGDLRDALEDLFFELSGILVFFFPVWSFVVAIVLGITTHLRMRAK